MDEKSSTLIFSTCRSVAGKSLSLDENAGSVTVTIEIAENTRLACPTCGKSCLFTITVIVNGAILILPVHHYC
uniref:Transposase n=1 Tax=Escherichia coli TaxID=562 RepID=A0A288W2J7_ECOLX|nr:hypothetical protein PMPNAOBH_00006 [Escherichia coli]